jgi:riboflavin kinase/FMN adenylyltransferase
MLAEKHNGESVLITFDPHPRKVLYPESAGKDLKFINSQEEKLELLRKSGLNNVIIIEFTREFSKVTSEQFIRDLLCGILNAKVVVVGFNHHFGFNKEGDYKQLWGWQKQYNFEAEEIPEQEVHNETVSSTKIRQAISEGYIQRANAYLDHYYIIMGTIEDHLSYDWPFMPPLVKIPITEESKILPSPGIYAVSVEAEYTILKGMAIIQTTQDGKTEVLLNIMDDISLQSGNKLTLCFHKKMHGAVNMTDSNSTEKVNMVKNQIIELIY